MDRKLKFGALAASATLGVSLGACGSGGGLARAQLVSKADAICATAHTQASAVSAPTNLRDPTVAAGYFDKIAPITDKETSELAALQADSSATNDWNAFISAQKSANSLLQTLKQKADAKDVAGLSLLAQVIPVGTKVQSAATRLGATVCAQ